MQPNQSELFRAVHTLVRSGIAKWQPTSHAEPTKGWTNIEACRIELGANNGRADEPVLAFLDEDGRAIEAFRLTDEQMTSLRDAAKTAVSERAVTRPPFVQEYQTQREQRKIAA